MLFTVDVILFASHFICCFYFPLLCKIFVFNNTSSSSFTFPAYPRRSDLAIALDVSSSISTTTFSSTIAFIKQHLYSKSISSGTTRVGLITFASKAYLKFSFEKYVNREGLYKRLEKLRRW